MIQLSHKKYQAYSLLLLFMVLAVCVIAYGLSQPGSVSSNILDMLPRQKMTVSMPLEKTAEKRFSIFLAEQSAADKLNAELSKLPFVQLGHQDALTTLKGVYQPYRHQLLSDAKRESLVETPPETLAQQALHELYSPLPVLRLYSFEDDPFNLGGAWLASLLPKSGLGAGSSIIEHEGQRWHIVSASLTGSPFDSNTATAIDQLVDAASASTATLKSGMIFHAAEAAELSSKEISTVGLASLVVILLVIVTLFRSIAAFIFIAIVILLGITTGLATTLLIVGEINVITIAFASTLLGLVVDYCFHFLSKYQLLASGGLAINAVRRSIWIGAISSAAVYLFQGLFAVNGLVQFAIFMASGLLASAATVILLGPFYEGRTGHYSGAISGVFASVMCGYQRVARCFSPAILLALITVVAIVLLTMANERDDVRALNSSSAELLQQERRVAEILKTPSFTRYLEITAQDQQHLLRKSLAVENQLEAGTDEPVDNYLVLGRVVPTKHQQDSDRSLVFERLYSPNGALKILCEYLDSDCLEFNISSSPTSANYLLPEGSTRLSELGFATVQTELSSKSEQVYKTQIFSQGSWFDDRAISGIEKVEYVDITADLSRSLAEMRVSSVVALLLFFLVLLVVLFFRYQRSAVFVLCAAVVSMSLALAPQAYSGISFFHVLAALLVLGLSIDAAIFYLELGLSPSTWLAVTASALTSLAAFGFLSLSQVPVLHQFGSVVLIGLMASWMLMPLLYLVFVKQEVGVENKID